MLTEQPADCRRHPRVGVPGRRGRCGRRGGRRRRCPRGTTGGRDRGGAGRRRRGAGLRCGLRGGRRNGRLRRGSGGSRGRGRVGLRRLDLGDLGVVRDGRALLGEDGRQHPRERRRDLRVHLVGDDLDDRLVLLDPVPGLLQPSADRALGDALAKLGHGHLRHRAPSSAGPMPRYHLRTRRAGAGFTAAGPLPALTDAAWSVPRTQARLTSRLVSPIPARKARARPTGRRAARGRQRIGSNARRHTRGLRIPGTPHEAGEGRQ